MMTTLEQGERNSHQYVAVADANILINELGIYKNPAGNW